MELAKENLKNDTIWKDEVYSNILKYPGLSIYIETYLQGFQNTY